MCPEAVVAWRPSSSQAVLDSAMCPAQSPDAVRHEFWKLLIHGGTVSFGPTPAKGETCAPQHGPAALQHSACNPSR